MTRLLCVSAVVATANGSSFTAAISCKVGSFQSPLQVVNTWLSLHTFASAFEHIRAVRRGSICVWFRHSIVGGGRMVRNQVCVCWRVLKLQFPLAKA